MAEEYQGGGGEVLTGFYNGLRQDLYRHQATLAKRAEQKQKQQADLEKTLGEEVAKLDESSLRNKDIPVFYKEVDKAKEIYRKIKTAKTDTERGTLTAEYRDAISKANLVIGKSKRRTSELLAIAPKLSEYGDEGKTYYQKLLNSSIEDIPDDVDFTRFKAKPNFTKASTWEENAVKTAITNGDKTFEAGKFGSLGGNAGQFVQEVKTANTEVLATKIASQYQFDEDYKALKDQEFPELAGDAGAIAKATVAKRAAELKIRDEDFIKTVKETGGESKTEAKKKETVDLREKNLRDIVFNQSQPAFETLKASLPANAKIKWLQVTDPQTGKSRAVGLEVDIPKTYDEYGNLQAAISTKIDFSKGDPMKLLNGLFNRYAGAKVTSEDLQKRGIKGNTSQNKSVPSQPNNRRGVLD